MQWWFITLRLVGQENEAALLLRLAERTSTLCSELRFHLSTTDLDFNDQAI
jgi:hypothetical protein